MVDEINNMDYTEKLIFLAEWYDYERSHLKHFYLQFYPFDNSVELYDSDRSRVYLRRTICDGVSVKDMFVGNTVRVYGRQLNITDYGDMRTRKLISKKTEKTLAVFKPTVHKHLGPLIAFLTERKFQFMRLKMCRLTGAEGLAFYDSKKTDAFLPFMVEQITSGPMVAAEIVGEDAVRRWKEMMGPKDPAVARVEAPESLRAVYGEELASNGFHGPDTDEEAVAEISYFFPKATTKHHPPNSCVELHNSTCCVIKPHVIESGNLGNILIDISARFKLTAMEIFYLSNANAEEFLEVYKGVIGDFNALMLSFIDGPCMALGISAAKEDDDCDIHAEFRKFAGPFDSEIARQIRPDTLRAKYGIDKYKNAIHCTDLAEDTTLELDYFFKILQD